MTPSAHLCLPSAQLCLPCAHPRFTFGTAVDDLSKWLAIIVLLMVGFVYAFYLFVEDKEACEEDRATIAVALWASMLTGDIPNLCMLSWYKEPHGQRVFTDRLPWLVGLTNLYL